jgi:hypothetical protein
LDGWVSEGFMRQKLELTFLSDDQDHLLDPLFLVLCLDEDMVAPSCTSSTSMPDASGFLQSAISFIILLFLAAAMFVCRLIDDSNTSYSKFNFTYLFGSTKFNESKATHGVYLCQIKKILWLIPFNVNEIIILQLRVL